MKKGFTLIELLAVIIILGIIALITFPIVDNSIKNSKQAALERTIGSIEEAAHNYSSQNNLGYSEEEKAISLDELKSSGFLTSDITNPVTNEEMTGCVLYRWDEAHNQYVFRYDEECKVNEEKPNLISTLLEQVGTKGLVQDETNSNIYYYVGGKDSYLDIKDYFWLGNRESSSDIRSVSDSGISSSVDRPSDAYGVRAVLYLKSGAPALTFTGGNGTAQSLYELN